MNFPITTKLTGVTFGDAPKNIRQFGCADIGTYGVHREPDNPCDENAIWVGLTPEWKMGYLRRDLARELAPMMDAGRRFVAEFVCRNEFPPHERIGITVRIVETSDN